jgi:amidase
VILSPLTNTFFSHKSGVVILGKTNLPELASDAQCTANLHPTCNNPRDITRTPGTFYSSLHLHKFTHIALRNLTQGGSSGGGGAAVSCGMSCIDIGSSIGGSIEIPAVCLFFLFLLIYYLYS